MDNYAVPFWQVNLRVDNSLVNNIDVNKNAAPIQALQKPARQNAKKKGATQFVSKPRWLYAMPLIAASMYLQAANVVEPAAASTNANQTEAAEVLGEKPKRKAPTFSIWEYEVHGVNVFDAETIENSLGQYLGQEKTLATVESAAHELEKLYRDSGYPVVVVDIPEQDVVGGKVKLLVTEGVVSNVKVAGSDYFLLSDIRARVPSIQVGSPLYIPKLQQELNSLNSLSSDLRVVPVLKQGDEPGSVGIELKVKDQLPMHGEIEYNNYASANTSPTRLSASIGYDNLWSKFHSFSLMMMVTPEAMEEIRVLSGTYVLPIEDGASRLAFYGVSSNSEINALTSTSSGLQIRGNSTIAGVRYVKPMNYSAEFQHVLTLGFDFKDVMEEIAFPDDPKAKGLLTPMSFGLWTAEYKATWRKPEATTRVGAGVYFGLRDVFNSDQEFNDKRFGGKPNFMYWKASYQRDTQLPADFSLVNKIKLQISDAPLISNEQLSIGGNATVRGYFESQNLGDRGVISSIEAYTPALFPSVKAISDFKILTFLEGAAVEVLQPLKDQEKNFVLASAGLGMQLTAWNDVRAELDWAFPLRDACSTSCGNSVGDVEQGNALTTFKITYKY